MSIAEKESNTPNTTGLPWKHDYQVKLPAMEDPKDGMFTEQALNVRFDSRVVGEIYDATLDEKK